MNHLKRTGLTIPYLVGARTLIEKFDPKGVDITALLEEIVQSRSLKYRPTLSYCGTIHEYVLGLEIRPSIDVDTVKNADGESSLVRQTMQSMSISEVIYFLELMYSPLVTAGHFSKGEGAFGEWHAFYDSDITHIRMALAIPV